MTEIHPTVARAITAETAAAEAAILAQRMEAIGAAATAKALGEIACLRWAQALHAKAQITRDVR